MVEGFLGNLGSFSASLLRGRLRLGILLLLLLLLVLVLDEGLHVLDSPDLLERRVGRLRGLRGLRGLQQLDWRRLGRKRLEPEGSGSDFLITKVQLASCLGRLHGTEPPVPRDWRLAGLGCGSWAGSQFYLHRERTTPRGAHGRRGYAASLELGRELHLLDLVPLQALAQLAVLDDELRREHLDLGMRAVEQRRSVYRGEALRFQDHLAIPFRALGWFAATLLAVQLECDPSLPGKLDGAEATPGALDQDDVSPVARVLPACEISAPHALHHDGGGHPLKGDELGRSANHSDDLGTRVMVRADHLHVLARNDATRSRLDDDGGLCFDVELPLRLL